MKITHRWLMGLAAALMVALAVAVSTAVTPAPTAMAQELGTLSGQVFVDLDGDGTPDNGESNLDGLQVKLYNRDSGALVATAVTGNDNYWIGGLQAGRYRVEVATPSPVLTQAWSTQQSEFDASGEGWTKTVHLPFKIDPLSAISAARRELLPKWGRQGQFGVWQMPGRQQPQYLGEGWDEVYNGFSQNFVQMHIVVQTWTGTNGMCQNSLLVSMPGDLWNGELIAGMQAMGFFEVEDQKEFYQVMRSGDTELWAWISAVKECETPSLPEWPTCKVLVNAPTERFWTDQGSDKSPFNVPDGTGIPGEGNDQPGERDFVARVEPNQEDTIDGVQCLVKEPCVAIRTRWLGNDLPWETFLIAERLDPTFSKPWRNPVVVWEDGTAWDLMWDGDYVFSNNEETDICEPTPVPTATMTPLPTATSTVTPTVQPTEPVTPTVTPEPTATSTITPTVQEANCATNVSGGTPMPGSACMPLVLRAPIVTPTPPATGGGPPTPTPTVTPVDPCPAPSKLVTAYKSLDAALNSGEGHSHGWVRFHLGKNDRSGYVPYRDAWTDVPHTAIVKPLSDARLDIDALHDGNVTQGTWNSKDKQAVVVYRPLVVPNHITAIRVTNSENKDVDVCLLLDPEL